MTSKKILIFVLSVVMLFVFSGCGKKDDTVPESEKAYGNYEAVITVENYGEIELILYGDKAPITVKNFIDLANEGFYDGLTFHRIIEGFMIQGGDPDGNGTGGSGKPIKGEFKSNGFENDISHLRGVISMARSKDPDSASSQFFIMHQDGTHLDGDYAAFGKVTKGMEVVDKIAEEAIVSGYNGEVNPENQPVIKSVKIKN